MRICTFDGMFGRLYDGHRERVTTNAYSGQHINWDLGHGNTRQVLSSGGTGNAISWSRDEANMGEQFAADVRATLVSQEQYDEAVKAAEELDVDEMNRRLRIHNEQSAKDFVYEVDDTIQEMRDEAVDA